MGQMLARLKHPGWVGIVLPLVLAVGSTFSPNVIRGFLLIGAFVAAVWTFHRTDYSGQEIKRTGIAASIFLTMAIAVFAFGHVLDVRPKSLARPVANLQAAQAELPVPSPSQGKLEAGSEVPAAVAPATILNNAPGGIINSGPGTIEHATVNNGPPEPTVNWYQVPAGSSLIGGELGDMLVSVSVDHTMEEPGFMASCDRPCITRSVSAPGDNNISTIVMGDEKTSKNIGILVMWPRPLGVGVKVRWFIKSQDGEPVRVLSVSKMSPLYLRQFSQFYR